MLDPISLNLLAEIRFTDFDFPSILVAALCGLVLVVGGLAGWVKVTGHDYSPSKTSGWLARLTLPAFWILVAVLSVTSFGAILLEGHMHGYPLLIHLGAAGAFVFVMVLVACVTLFYGDEETFYESSNRWWLVRWTAALALVSGIITAGSMFFSMLPILGTEGLLQAASVHRFSGLAMVGFVVIHITAIGLTRLGLR